MECGIASEDADDLDSASRPPQTALPIWQTSPGWWFRRIGVPLLALISVAGAIVWLERPSDTSERLVATGDEPLAADSSAPQEGSFAPEFRLTTLDGRELRLSDFRGSVVLLNFWATWCGPCRQEMPLFEQALGDHAESGLVVLAVNVEEGSAKVRPFVERLELTYTIAMDEKGAVSRRYRVRSFPTTYFIGRDGRVEGRRVGEYSRSILFGRLDQLLGEP